MHCAALPGDIPDEMFSLDVLGDFESVGQSNPSVRKINMSNVS